MRTKMTKKKEEEDGRILQCVCFDEDEDCNLSDILDDEDEDCNLCVSVDEEIGLFIEKTKMAKTKMAKTFFHFRTSFFFLSDVFVGEGVDFLALDEPGGALPLLDPQ